MLQGLILTELSGAFSLARLTRQQLKRDEFAVWVESVQEFFLEHYQLLIKGGVAVVIAAALGIGGYLYVNSRQDSASNAFTAALATFHAPVGTAAPSTAPRPHFNTNAEKYQAAMKQFGEVASRYSWTAQGRFARYYSALCQKELGNVPEAEKELTDLAGSRDHELAALAKMALAGIYEASARNDEAEKLYRDLADHPTNTVPKATAELALADLYQRTKPAQATALYQQIEKEYPGTAAGDQASKMLEAQTR